METFDASTIKDAKDQYEVRRQDDKPGTTITPLSIGDESFMACGAPSKGSSGSCESYTRLSNMVFQLGFESFESFEVRNARDPASVVRALTAQATQHLSQAGR